MGRELRTFLSEDSYPEDLEPFFDDPSLMNVRPLEKLYKHIYARQEDPDIEIAFQFEAYEVKKNHGLLPRHPRQQFHTFDDVEDFDYGDVSMRNHPEGSEATSDSGEPPLKFVEPT
jgi:hypothetical protein